MSYKVPVVHTVEDMRAFVRARRASGERIGLVPTMGALHAGHLSLVEEARRHAERVITTIFVNPTQFGPSEDFSRYPRTLAADCEKLATVSADLVFAPAVEEMYPEGFCTTVTLEGPAKADLEDRFRPTHFAGVATVVAKLLNQAQADVAVFGEKDYQQLLVIRHLARDLDIGTRILAGPTLRDLDGLAMSSRNIYLSAEDRARAPRLYRALSEAASRIAAGEVVGHVMGEAHEAIVGAGFDIDYVEARHADTLARVARRLEGPMRILAAARLGATRLIDNVAVPNT
ncbi:pantoate--beta-alanine ligase [Methylocystis sp. MJC1]|jgi:pantoate--beta-alanine ligase|uniref:pantoate--beta-alanine ligase n=1 Tax=Methylocystis sp. MJC1 TaxID=2654282 RepID=UPI0013EBACC7|nr:pantoate--beta-alanine ligase [Methylocystis sp. MJC1]KAF2990157.1 Pantothenate synthetase [Methylocystis sp. MJC1]MBU6527592.1 pantoate--beta-alanine ligase [Methylocystis sp. MJC1]UZX10531.1 pantoate--beta-alanine ligase [Methylocystis sp. MJC1]